MKSQLIALFSALSFFGSIFLSSCGAQSNQTTTPTSQETATIDTGGEIFLNRWLAP